MEKIKDPTAERYRISSEAEELFKGYQSNTVSLAELAGYFRIYGIDNDPRNISVNFQQSDDIDKGPCLTICDTSDPTNNITYKGTIIFNETKNGRLVLNGDGAKVLVNIIPGFHNYEIERLYYEADKTYPPIYEQLVIYDDFYVNNNHQIIFKRQSIRDQDSGMNVGDVMNVIYNEATNVLKKESRTPVRRLLILDTYGKFGENKSQIWRSSTESKFSYQANPQTNYLQTIGNDDGLFFRVGFRDKNTELFFKGTCIENYKSAPRDYHDFKTDIDKIQSKLGQDDKDIYSVLYFRGNLFSKKEQSIVIEKTYDRIYINFDGKKYSFFSSINGCVNCNDIKLIINYLNDAYGNSTFVQNVIANLEKFLEKMETRDYGIFDEFSFLNPELLSEYPLSKILNSLPKDDNFKPYFQEMKNRVEGADPKEKRKYVV